MPAKLLLLLTVLAVTSLQHSAFGQVGKALPVPLLPPGVHNQSLLNSSGLMIRYAIAIPAGYAPSNPVPLVVALHYGGDPNGAGSGVLNILVRPALEELGAIIIAPDSVGGPWTTPENEHAVNTLIEGVFDSYNIDRGKILVTGFSMGGAGTWHFASKYFQRFRARHSHIR